MAKGFDKKFMKPIPGFKNYYAYKNGRIYHLFNGKKFRQLGQHLMPNSKYLSVYLYRSTYDKTTVYVHKAVAMSHFRIKPSRYTITHKDKNIFNNRPSNLQYLRCKALKNKSPKKVFEENDLRDAEAEAFSSINYDNENGLWKRYLQLKAKGNIRARKNFLKLFLKLKGLCILIYFSETFEEIFSLSSLFY